jgi:hypothetical protein
MNKYFMAKQNNAKIQVKIKMNYRNSNLGLATKTRVCKGVGQE